MVSCTSGSTTPTNALDSAEINTRVTSALQLIETGVDAAPKRDLDSVPGMVEWQTWVVD